MTQPLDRLDKPLYNVKVSDKEKQFIEFWRELGFGILKQVIIANGEPERVDMPMKQVKFTNS